MTSSLTHITRNNMHERACTSVGLGPVRHPLRGAVGKCATPSPPHFRAPFTNQGTIVRDSYGHVVITCTVPTTGRYRLRSLTNIKGRSVPFLKIFVIFCTLLFTNAETEYFFASALVFNDLHNQVPNIKRSVLFCSVFCFLIFVPPMLAS